MPVQIKSAQPGQMRSLRDWTHLAPLPNPLTTFVGREREAGEVLALLRRPGVRLVTLVGPGGVGKTRLALRVAELAAEWFDGVAFVALDPISDPDRVLPAIARAVGVREEGERPLTARLAAAFGERSLALLLVLDNIEQVVAAGPRIGTLLEAAPRLKVLATGRAAWRLSGEQEFPVPPLALPEPGRLPPVAKLAETEAVALFTRRARAVRPDFVLSETNAAAVVEICRRLDGLPLAIELAAARAKVLSPQALLARLEYRLPLLGGGPRDLPARLRTMRDAVAWSYDLLTPDERALFRRLSVFVGGFDLEAAEAVSRGVEESGSRGVEGVLGDSDILDGICSLVDKSLLNQREGPGGESRYGMLETIREYGLDRLAEDGGEVRARDAHLDHFLALAERAEPELTGPQQVDWLDRLEAEHYNMQAALGWALEAGRIEAGLCLAGALLRYWEHHSHYAEERRWLEAALARSAGLPPGVRGKALHAVGVLAFLQGDHARAAEALAEADALYREAGNDYGAAFALNRLGTLALHAGDHQRADATFARAEGLIRAVGDADGIAAVLGQLGYAALVRGDHEGAFARLEESLAHYRAHGSKLGSGRVLIHLGRTFAARGEFGRALPLLKEALALTTEVGNRGYQAEGLEALAAAVARAGDPQRAARLWGAAAAMRAAIGAPLPPADRSWYDDELATLERRLGQEAFVAAMEAGRLLTPDEAITEAATVDIDPGGTAASNRTPSAETVGLTPREIEILRLLAAGLTNVEIAEALFISPRTASTHVGNIFGKIGVSSRSAAAAYAHRHGLV